jgi:nitrous oxidase accessory protein NosD
LKKKALITTAFISILLFSAVAGIAFVNMAKADPMFFLPNILIKSDGSIEPETEVITRTGNVYSLTVDIIYQYTIKIQCSNILLDGAGHIINGTLPSIERGRWFSDGNGLSIEDVTNVTVRNIEITGFNDFDVVLENSRACYFLKMKADDGVVLENSSSNLITECNLAALTEAVQPGVYLSSSNSNKFSKNDIEDIFLTNSNDNNFLENNFVIDNFPNVIISGKNVWDNRSVGNYWSNYLIKYPNASEIGNTGIGDTPYVINSDNIDYYPLIAPFAVPPAPTSSPEPQPEAEPFPTVLVVTSVIIAALVGTSLLVYFKKREH